MKNRTGALALILVLILSAAQSGAFADMFSPLERKNWTAFPLGSWVIYDEEADKDGEVVSERIRKQYVMNHSSTGQDIQISSWDGKNWYSIDRWISNSQLKPERLKLVKEEAGEITIGNRIMDATFRTYRLEEKYGPDLYEIILEAVYVKEPVAGYRNIELGRRSMRLDPDCVSANLTLNITFGDRSIMRYQTSQRIFELDKEVDWDGGVLLCVVEDFEGTEGFIGWPPSKVFSGIKHLSQEVPGGVVINEVQIELEDGISRLIGKLVDFHIAEPALDFNATNLPPLEERPVIPGNQWAGMRLGAWKIEISATTDKSIRFPSMWMSKVLAVNKAEGTYIVSSEGLVGSSAGAKWSRLVDPSLRGFFPVEERKTLEEIEIIVIDGIEIPCEVVTEKRVSSVIESTTETKSWIPIEEGHKQLASNAPGGVVRQEIKDTYGDKETFITERRILKWKENIDIDGREISVTRRLINTGSDMNKIELVSSEAPGWKIASVDLPAIEDGGKQLSMLAAWGEAERAIPDDIDGRALELTDIINGFSVHYDPWYGWEPGAWIREDFRWRRGFLSGTWTQIVNVNAVDWFGVPFLNEKEVFKTYMPISENLYSNPIPGRWDAHLKITSEEPAVFEYAGVEIDCVKEVWETDIFGGSYRKIELLRSSKPVAINRTYMFGHNIVGIGPDIVSMNFLLKSDNYTFGGELKLLSTSERIEINGREVECIRESGYWKMVIDEEELLENFERLLSHEIPGQNVRYHSELKYPDYMVTYTRNAVDVGIPKPTPNGSRMRPDHPGWGNAAKGAFARFDYQAMNFFHVNPMEMEYVERLHKIYDDGEHGQLLITDTDFKMQNSFRRSYAPALRDIKDDPVMSMREMRNENINIQGRDVQTVREEWISKGNALVINLWKTDEIELIDREVKIGEFHFHLTSDVVRMMARLSVDGRETFIRRRLDRLDAPFHIGDTGFQCIEESERIEINGEIRETTRYLLTDLIPGGLAAKSTILGDEEDGYYINLRAVEFGWGGEE